MDFLSNGWWLLLRCFCRVTVLITVSVQRGSVHFCFCALWKCKNIMVVCQSGHDLTCFSGNAQINKSNKCSGNKSNANKLNHFFSVLTLLLLTWKQNILFFFKKYHVIEKENRLWETRTKSAILEQKSKSIVTSIVWVTPSIIRCMFQYLLLEGFIRSLLWQGSSSNSLQLYKADTSGSWHK